MKRASQKCPGPDSAATTALYGLGRPWVGVGLLTRESTLAVRCPFCDSLVITRVEEHFSCATHIAACLLCALGCWPCCVLPYFMGMTRTTYHSCPVCFNLLGSYEGEGSCAGTEYNLP